jgi:hypothetical protein
MGKISGIRHNLYVDLPWCLIAGQRSYALVLDAIAYAEGRRRRLPGMAKSHVLARGPIRPIHLQFVTACAVYTYYWACLEYTNKANHTLIWHFL